MIRFGLIFVILTVTVNGDLFSEPGSLHDLPWTIDEGNWIISAKLYEPSDRHGKELKVYDIQEYIHSSDIIRGKITVSSINEQDKVDIFYSSIYPNGRTVLRGDDCGNYLNQKAWNRDLFPSTQTKTLLNHVLMTGPSILFRLNGKNLIWTQEEDTAIRGFPVHSATASFGQYLTITNYYKVHLDQPDLTQASRIQFSGLDPTFEIRVYPEKFYLDIHSLTRVREDLDKIVTAPPGFGCPAAKDLIKFVGAPRLSGSNFHFISEVKVDGAQKSITRNEMYINSGIDIGRLKTTNQGRTTEILYDYQLGLSYKTEGGTKCLIESIGPGTLGVNDKWLEPDEIFHYTDYYSYDYVGTVYLDHVSHYGARVWERIEINIEHEGTKYDKFVTSHYFVPNDDARLFTGHVLVRTTLNGFNKDKTGSYKLVQSTRIDYQDIEASDSDHEKQVTMQFSDCYPSAYDRKTFAIHLNCKESDNPENGNKNCIKFAEKHNTVFMANLKRELSSKGISNARIANADLVFDDKEIIVMITLLKVPDMKYSLKSSPMRVAEDTIKHLQTISVQSEDDCLKGQASMGSRIEAIVYCHDYDYGTDKVCGRVEKKETIKEVKVGGRMCTVYYPYMRIENYAREVHLERLEDHLNKNKLELAMFQDKFGTFIFDSIQVEDVTDQKNLNGAPFRLVDTAHKLTESVQDRQVSNFGDCHKTCIHSDEFICETFAYCEHAGKFLCQISNRVYTQLTPDLVSDVSCKVYSKNRLLDYVKIGSKKFKQPQEVAVDFDHYDCASSCSSSENCFSFQDCGYSCSLNGYYTDSQVEMSEKCDIYIPKVSHKFQSQGSKIVSEVFLTEFNLNFDQCAALCYGWMNTDERCQSFNYCPKSDSTSSCSLTKFSVKDASTKTIASETCQNFELQTQPDKQKQKNEKQNTKKTTSGGTAFALVTLFLAVGLVVGFIAPFTSTLIHKINRKVSSSLFKDENTFTWSRQIDGPQEDVG